MRYRVEILVWGEVAGAMETENYREARKYYLAHRDNPDCWTQLYLDGAPVPRKRADKAMAGARERSFQVLSRIENAKRGKGR